MVGPLLVDTSIWSLALRRRRKDLSSIERTIVFTFGQLVQMGHAVIIGPVRLEILSGINDETFFQRARDYLREFDDEQLTRDDFEGAAALCNRCTARGVASTPSDLLICVVALRLGIPIFTQDADFKRYGQVVPLELPSALQIAKYIEQSKHNGFS